MPWSSKMQLQTILFCPNESKNYQRYKILARLIILLTCKRNGHKLARSCKNHDRFCKMCQILAGLNYKFLARPFCMGYINMRQLLVDANNLGTTVKSLCDCQLATIPKFRYYYTVLWPNIHILEHAIIGVTDTNTVNSGARCGGQPLPKFRYCCNTVA